MKFSLAMMMLAVVHAAEKKRGLLRTGFDGWGDDFGFGSGSTDCTDDSSFSFDFSMYVASATDCFNVDQYCLEQSHEVAVALSQRFGYNVEAVAAAVADSDAFCRMTSQALAGVSGYIDMKANIKACRFGGIGAVNHVDMTTDISTASIGFAETFTEAAAGAYAAVATGAGTKADFCDEVPSNYRSDCVSAYAEAKSTGVAEASAYGQSASLAVASSSGELKQSLTVKANSVKAVTAIIGAAVGSFSWANGASEAGAAAQALAASYAKAITEICSGGSQPSCCQYLGSNAQAAAEAIVDSAAFGRAFSSAISRLYIEANVAAQFEFGMLGGQDSVHIIENNGHSTTVMAAMCVVQS